MFLSLVGDKVLRDYILIYINGVRHEIRADHAHKMLSDYLRYDLQLTGTKIVCAEGDCGACTILKLHPHSSSVQNLFIPINACIMTVAQMDGSSLVTVDAMKSPVQDSMVQCHGSQCGFCTPGFVMALSGLVEKKQVVDKKPSSITPVQAKNYLTGNLCRCTGYQSIIDAATAIDVEKCSSVTETFFSKAQQKELRAACQKPVFIEGKGYSFFAPVTLRELATYMEKNKDVRLIGAGTDLGVLVNKNKIQLTKLVSLHLVSELYRIETKKDRMTVGARVTLAELRRALEGVIPEFHRFLDLFASPQIKNVATLIGNVANASPIADTPPFLLVANAVVHIWGIKGVRKVPLDEFYLDYRKTALKTGEWITSIEFDIPKVTERLALFKTSQRKDLDISCVNTAFRMHKNKDVVEHVSIAVGGVGPIPLRLKKTEKFLQGQVLTDTVIEKASEIMQKEITPLSDLRGTSGFRRVLVENYFGRFFSEGLNK